MSETHHLGAVSQEDVYSSQHYAMPSPGQLPVAGSLYAQSAVNSLKRGAPTVEDNVFESDGKVPDKKRRRQTKPTKKRPSDTVQLSATGGLSYPAPPGFGLGESGGPVAGVPDLDTLSQRSRQIAAANRKPKEPQSRVAWTRNDCQLLIRAVESFSCKWSHIEEEIKNGLLPFEHKRDQQALRDKARLLKQDFLKSVNFCRTELTTTHTRLAPVLTSTAKGRIVSCPLGSTWLSWERKRSRPSLLAAGTHSGGRQKST